MADEDVPGVPAALPAATAPSENPAEAAFPIVGIGASAGGLAAFEAFFSGMPAEADPGMAFVLVQHLAPDHKSILADLIRRYTRMQVFEVEDGMKVQVNCAYIIPPNRQMAFLNGTLQLLEPAEPRGQRLPIDFFFRSLAQDQHERAIGIVLSGTGSDGTLGVRAIKGEAGMVMAQNPESAEFDGMPRSALSTGLVDWELPPAEMPMQLITYATHAFGKLPRIAAQAPSNTENALKKVFVLLRAQTGHDFSQYKPSTIHRRILRRMAVHQIEAVDGYVRYLQQAPAEVDALFRDLLIGVTSFFRDPEAFQTLDELILPRLFADRPAGGVLRLWAAGCSTGEEAYSLAILLQERIEALRQSYSVQIFATDIDARAIAVARTGVYPASIAADVSRERLARFFTPDPDGGCYRIHKSIRDMLVFSEHDLIKDPPFSRLDFISCRNLLIYLGADLQKSLIPLFHYALNPSGVLFLGTAESVGDSEDLFAVVDRKAKLYRRKEALPSGKGVAFGRFLPPVMALPRSGAKAAFPVKPPLRELTEQALLEAIAPAAALINGQGDILYLHGRSGRYLEPTPGETGVNNIVKMAREGLQMELGAALHKARGSNQAVRVGGLRVRTNGDFTAVNLCVRPLTSGPAAALEQSLYLVVLEEAELDEEQLLPASACNGDAQARIDALSKELRARDEYLQSTQEELEASNEELKSSNEEMQSVNEELQSTNEELETSKEELQSVNEELATLNAELSAKVVDLSRANNDMNNLLAGTGIATVFLDHQLRILRFTPATTGVINLIRSDVGRPVGHIASNLVAYDSLVGDAQSVLDTLAPKEVEVQATDGNWFAMRMRPYRTVDNVIEGVVITFLDVTEMKRTAAALRETQAILQAALDNSQAGIAIADAPDGVLRYVNEAGLLMRGADALPLASGVGIAQYGAYWQLMAADGAPLPPDEVPLARAILFGESCNREFVIRRGPHDERSVMANAVPIRDAGGRVSAAVMVFLDVTERRQLADLQRKTEEMSRLAVVVRDAYDAVTVHDLEGRILAWNPAAVALYGWSEAEALQMNVRQRIPEALREDALAFLLALGRGEVFEPLDTQRLCKDGTLLEVRITATALGDQAGHIHAIATTERARVRQHSPA